MVNWSSPVEIPALVAWSMQTILGSHMNCFELTVDNLEQAQKVNQERRLVLDGSGFTPTAERPTADLTPLVGFRWSW